MSCLRLAPVRHFTSRAGAKLKILVMDCYDKTGRERLDKAGATPANELFTAVMAKSAPADVSLDFDVAFPADAPHATFDRAAFEGYDGIAWTGSSLTSHEDRPEVRCQVSAMREGFASRVPMFGSCWGMQIGAVAVGIQCERNQQHGREQGVSQAIGLTAAGKAHPFMRGKQASFDAPTAHTDHVSPAWAAHPHSTQANTTVQLLAGNAHSPVQALAIEVDGSPLWSVQYHPEYTIKDIAVMMVIPTTVAMLLEQGAYPDLAAIEEHARLFQLLHESPNDEELRARLNVGADLVDDRHRNVEFENWLHMVCASRKGVDRV